MMDWSRALLLAYVAVFVFGIAAVWREQRGAYELMMTAEAGEGGVLRFDGVALASWYGPDYHGLETASGEIFDQDGMTLAVSDAVAIPYGADLEVCRLAVDVGTIAGSVQMPRDVGVLGIRCVRARVNDRMPPHPYRDIDLSREVARRLGMIDDGLAVVAWRRIR